MNILHGKHGRILLRSELISGSTLGFMTLGESFLGLSESTARGLESQEYIARAYMWQCNQEIELADTSVMQQEWKDFLAGLGSFSGTFEAWFDVADAGRNIILNEFFNVAVLSRKSILVEFWVDHNDTGYISARILPNLMHHDVGIADAQSVACDFVGQGQPVWVDVTNELIGGLYLGFDFRHQEAYWGFEEGAGSSANDSMYGNDGTLVSAPVWVAGVATPNALQFDGVSSHVTIPKQHDFRFMLRQSVSVLFKATAVPASGWHGLIGDDGLASGFRLSLQHSTGKVKYDLTSNGGYSVTTTGSIVPSEWNHIVATYDGATMQIYLNGQLDPSADTRPGWDAVTPGWVLSSNPSSTDASLANDSAITIGKVGTDYAKGIIDEARVYAGALTEEQIRLMYNIYESNGL